MIFYSEEVHYLTGPKSVACIKITTDTIQEFKDLGSYLEDRIPEDVFVRWHNPVKHGYKTKARPCILLKVSKLTEIQEFNPVEVSEEYLNLAAWLLKLEFVREYGPPVGEMSKFTRYKNAKTKSLARNVLRSGNYIEYIPEDWSESEKKGINFLNSRIEKIDLGHGKRLNQGNYRKKITEMELKREYQEKETDYPPKIMEYWKATPQERIRILNGEDGGFIRYLMSVYGTEKPN